MTQALDFDTVQPGEEVGTVAYDLPADFNVQRLASLGMADTRHLRDPDGREVAEPSILCGQHSWTFRKRFHWTGSVHAKCDVEFLAPTYVGTRISIVSRLVEKYERRGGRYVVLEMENRNEQGKVTTRVRNTMLLNYADVRGKRDNAAREAPLQAPEAGAPPAGLVYGPKKLSRDELISFFECEEKIYGPLPSIHTDIARAQKLGLPDIVAPGRYALGLFYTGLFRLYGTRWLRGASFSVSIRNNVAPGLEVSMRAPYQSDCADGGRAFKFSCRDADSRPIVTGSFSLPR